MYSFEFSNAARTAMFALCLCCVMWSCLCVIWKGSFREESVSLEDGFVELI